MSEQEKMSFLHCFTFMLSKAGSVLVDFVTDRALVAAVVDVLRLHVLHDMGLVPTVVRAFLARPQRAKLHHLGVYLLLDGQKDI